MTPAARFALLLDALSPYLERLELCADRVSVQVEHAGSVLGAARDLPEDGAHDVVPVAVEVLLDVGRALNSLPAMAGRQVVLDAAAVPAVPAVHARNCDIHSGEACSHEEGCS